MDIYISAAKRTPIGKFNGALSGLSAVQLASGLIPEILKQGRTEKERIDDLILGNVLQAGLGQNVARQVAMAHLPKEIPAVTVNMVCGSGLRTVAMAAQALKAGDAHAILAGGTESMSNAPYLLPKARQGYKLGHQTVIDSMIQDGLWDAFGDYHMGITAENVATQYNINRHAQDDFSLRSHQKAIQAQKDGKFDSEIVPIHIPQRKGDPLIVSTDEGPRADSTLETLSKLAPAFQKEGSVTAGNASSLNDGAAMVLVSTGAHLKKTGATPIARIASYAWVGIDPSVMGVGPVAAVEKALSLAGWRLEDVDLIEANEAFASQSLAIGNILGFPIEKLNVNGGAIALGHPIGASGTRILVTLLYELERRNLKKGIATLCIGGGMGIAMCIER